MNRTDWSPHVPSDDDLLDVDDYAGPCRITAALPGPNAVIVSDLTAEIRRLRSLLPDGGAPSLGATTEPEQ